MLIVEEPVPVAVDRDIVLVIDDWRLTSDGKLDEASFRSFHDAAHDGRIGAHLTVNSAPALDLPVRRNERLRLRLVNAANARVLELSRLGTARRVGDGDRWPAGRPSWRATAASRWDPAIASTYSSMPPSVPAPTRRSWSRIDGAT